MNRWRAVGDTGWLLDVELTGGDLLDARRVLAVAHQVQKAAGAGLVDGVVDVVPAAATVLVTTTPGRHARLGAWLATLALVTAMTGDEEGPPATMVTLRVRFDGDDLAATADLTARSVEALVATLTGVTWTAAFTGFAPGFAYLVGGGLDVPRRSSPRPLVPAGTLGLAGRYAGIYPRATPGGWRLIGRAVDLPRLFDAERSPPALISPGTRVRFVSA